MLMMIIRVPMNGKAIMLQVPKLNIVLADKTKSDLLDNISYKLRSLLHSI
jgi:hypothetical protein